MEKSFVILPDVTCDISEKLAKEYGIEVVYGHYTTPDGVEHKSYHEWTDEEREKFYAALKKNPNGFTTSPPNIDECYTVFEKYVKENVPVIAISISEKLSGTYGFMTKAREEILKKYPSAEVYVIDSLRFSVGFGLMAIIASIMRDQGKSAKEVYEYLEANKNRIHETGWMDDLSFVAKKGRISNAKAFFGTLAGIKPLGEFDNTGLTTVIGKVKGEKAAYSVLLDYIEQHIENPKDQIIMIATSTRHKQAQYYKEQIEARFSPKAVYVVDVFPNSGINVGPGLMAAYYFGKPISDGLVEEKKAIAEIINKK